MWYGVHAARQRRAAAEEKDTTSPGSFFASPVQAQPRAQQEEKSCEHPILAPPTKQRNPRNPLLLKPTIQGRYSSAEERTHPVIAERQSTANPEKRGKSSSLPEYPISDSPFVSGKLSPISKHSQSPEGRSKTAFNLPDLGKSFHENGAATTDAVETRIEKSLTPSVGAADNHSRTPRGSSSPQSPPKGNIGFVSDGTARGSSHTVSSGLNVEADVEEVSAVTFRCATRMDEFEQFISDIERRKVETYRGTEMSVYIRLQRELSASLHSLKLLVGGGDPVGEEPSREESPSPFWTPNRSLSIFAGLAERFDGLIERSAQHWDSSTRTLHSAMNRNKKEEALTQDEKREFGKKEHSFIEEEMETEVGEGGEDSPPLRVQIAPNTREPRGKVERKPTGIPIPRDKAVMQSAQMEGESESAQRSHTNMAQWKSVCVKSPSLPEYPVSDSPFVSAKSSPISKPSRSLEGRRQTAVNLARLGKTFHQNGPATTDAAKPQIKRSLTRAVGEVDDDIRTSKGSSPPSSPSKGPIGLRSAGAARDSPLSVSSGLNVETDLEEVRAATCRCATCIHESEQFISLPSDPPPFAFSVRAHSQDTMATPHGDRRAVSLEEPMQRLGAVEAAAPESSLSPISLFSCSARDQQKGRVEAEEKEDEEDGDTSFISTNPSPLSKRYQSGTPEGKRQTAFNLSELRESFPENGPATSDADEARIEKSLTRAVGGADDDSRTPKGSSPPRSPSKGHIVLGSAGAVRGSSYRVSSGLTVVADLEEERAVALNQEMQNRWISYYKKVRRYSVGL
uniref:Uncharacterized protein n=1 Tax=Chromera velia CCMP2878 TaxID=1169474 RepID=A0A0G4IE67_9ALVE|eukprot:Cvel_13631.t1-p1 / transcript=Cvel_13631.t1 / gene=Cvel_13631 / organism=Chromera_velia_CCMP2878 / gene_product=hypothetical protein / transcript_product=hypothetical protein / location=Cvel_scaffold939:36754-40411(+) / protein_length=793 / sequence_SO=supercontig / SO=protein_coding / is_pseudo=false